MINYIQSDKLLTIIIITYNRIQWLHYAISSCLRQTDKNFSLLIYDNGSSDATNEFLSEFKTDDIPVNVIRSDVNVFSMTMFNRIAPHLSTPWATILSDDDMIKEDFVNKVNNYLASMKNGILVMGFDIINENNKVTAIVEPKQLEMSMIGAADKLFSSTGYPTAGIGGFVFLSEVLKKYEGHYWDYPRLFFCDTRLVIEGVLSGGIKVVPDVLYQRRNWEGAVSHSSVEQILAKFKAQLLFMEDCGQRIRELSNVASKQYSKYFYSVKSFFNMNILPCILQNKFAVRDSLQMMKLAYQFNKIFIPHCLLLIVAVILNCSLLRKVGKEIRHIGR